MLEKKVYLTPRQLIERFDNHVTEKTLANWRVAGTGPLFTRVGGKILYPLEEVEKWEKARTVSKTSEYSARGKPPTSQACRAAPMEVRARLKPKSRPGKGRVAQ